MFQVVECETGKVLPRLQVLLFVEIGKQVGNQRPSRVNGQLLQVANLDIVGIGDISRVGRLLPYQYLQHGRLARPIGGDKRRLVALLDAKSDILE